jgi:hypothetical protein
MIPLTLGAAYERGKGFLFCPPCPAGTSPFAGSACETCPKDTYSSAGSVACLPCPIGSSTGGSTGNTNISACTCNTFLYSGSDASGKLLCQKCPAGARCPDGTCAFQDLPQSCGIQGTWVMTMGEMRLADCPPGSLLANASMEAQICLPCPAATYSFSPTDGCKEGTCLERECNPCPVGARCNGGDHFQPLDSGSIWEKIMEGATSLMRVKACPLGHVLVRNPSRPEADECVSCPANTYMVQQASYVTGKGVSSSAAILQSGLDLCLPCPAGSICNGKDEVISPIGLVLFQVLCN